MFSSPGSAILRRPNVRVLFFAFLLCYSGYCLWSSPSSPREQTRRTPSWVVPPPVTVTRTVVAPAETVTVTAVPVPEPPQAPLVLNEPRAPPPLLLNGPPTMEFRDNLHPEVKYITAWPGSGFTNDVILFMNLLYLSLQTQRVAIMPYFTPTHISRGDPTGGPTIDFGDVFDVPRLERALGQPVIEWWQVKDRTSKKYDALGCWNVWQAVNKDHKGPHFTVAPQRLKLDVSYTTAPASIKLLPNVGHDTHMTYAALAALSFSETRKRKLKGLPPPGTSPVLKAELPPDEQVMCFDNLYWAASAETHEIQRDYSPSWRFVGEHMHWTPTIEARAEDYLRKAFGLAPGESVPSYIAIHARRGDFSKWCRDGVPQEECLAPLSAYAKRVDEVRAALLEAKGLLVERVVMTSDETDAVWWAEVRARGWAVPEHADTARLLGRWAPVHIDGAIQSGAMGLVGTDQSTVSIVAGRRVVSWQGGVVRMVKWGRLGADDH
ncbi:hypothetical protein FB451DRAFT_1029523 [Mycena latifolia]|nr:hypothetical protein FB451DRAFT_1029523 [Mycena latifolia]